MVRVLQVVTYMGRGGLETMLMNYYRHIDRSRVQFDFLVHRPFEADYDAEIRDMGGKIYRVSRLIPWSRAYRAELRNFFHAHPDYRIVHVHQDCLSAVALQCARDCGVPVRIAHSHSGNQTRNIKYLIKRYYMKQIPAAATHLFACGRQAGDWMFGGSPYRVIPNAIEVPNYRYDPQLSRQVRQERGLAQNGLKQKVQDAVIYPPEFFNPYDSTTGELNRTSKTVSIHWYAANWMNKRQKIRGAIGKPLHRWLGKDFFRRT